MARRGDSKEKAMRAGERRMEADEQERRPGPNRRVDRDCWEVYRESALQDVAAILRELREIIPVCAVDSDHCHVCLSKIVDRGAELLFLCDDRLEALESVVSGCPEGLPVGVETG